MAKEPTNIFLEPQQKEWFKKRGLNLSATVRNLINERMQEYAEFERFLEEKQNNHKVRILGGHYKKSNVGGEILSNFDIRPISQLNFNSLYNPFDTGLE